MGFHCISVLFIATENIGSYMYYSVMDGLLEMTTELNQNKQSSKSRSGHQKDAMQFKTDVCY